MRSLATRLSVMSGEGALSVFARAKELERQRRSIIHLELGEPVEALQYFEKALQLDPGDTKFKLAYAEAGLKIRESPDRGKEPRRPD